MKSTNRMLGAMMALLATRGQSIAEHGFLPPKMVRAMSGALVSGRPYIRQRNQRQRRRDARRVGIYP